MVKNFKKMLPLLIMVIISFMALSLVIKVKASTLASGTSEMLYELDPTSNFFTQVEDKTPIVITDKRDTLAAKGYQKACENDKLEVYFHAKTCGIAVYDKVNGYLWYSCYQNEPNYGITSAVKIKNESGVCFEYSVVDSKGAIKSEEIYFNARNKKTASGTVEMVQVEDGFDLNLDFASYGISFKVEIRINGSKLSASVPYESIKEVTVGTLNKKDCKLTSITLFPYFGSENYLINGYSFIPDGSGALIRYNDNVSSTAYEKKIYGYDQSFDEYSSSYHIKENGSLSLPIYGVNHGYNQAAFLCEVKSGYGSCELHSYPYMYNLIPFNTTNFKYIVRDTFTVNLTSQTMYLLNDSPYPSDYSIEYTFLENEDASYVGMAKAYRESLGLTNKEESENDIPLRLEVLGVDYKPGLFGKNYVKMTTYQEALDIVNDLENNGVNNFNLTYLGWNRGGYFTKSATNAKPAIILGGKSKLKKLSSYLDDKGYSIDYTVNPNISTTYAANKNVKKIGLSPFEVSQTSSLEQLSYYVAPTELAKTINSKDRRYASLNIKSLKIDNMNVAYSYRYKSVATYRTQMIDQMVNEVSNLNGYNLSTSKPNSYLLKYLTNYYDGYYESNKYIYETDSIPFMTLLLDGAVNQYMPNINYVSDYELAALRMIEYNLYPSFIITKEEAYDLRYTNYEYLNSTQYLLWKDLIIKMYNIVNDGLKYVASAHMIDHEYVLAGVAKCTYDNGVTIYVNYNKTNVDVDGVSLTPCSYLVKGGN